MRRALTIVAALLLCSCEEPPNKEIAAAEQQIEQARKAGAEQYAPARLGEAEAAMQDAHRKVGEKDYRGALSSATDAADKARGAAKAASAARTLARGAAELAQAEARVALEEVAEIREQARKGRVPDTVFEELEPRVRKVSDDLESAAATLQRGDVLEAQQAAAAIKAEAAPLPGLFRNAMEGWKAARPKGRVRTPAKPAKPPARKR